jgi:hypothetical protein
MLLESWHFLCASKFSFASLTTAEDPAFKGFRQSGNRMKEASPIASLLYGLIPKEKKEYALYRTLTGEALRMIKQGMAKEEIIVALKEQYINPLIEQDLKLSTQPEEQIRFIMKLRPERKCLRTFGTTVFTSGRRLASLISEGEAYEQMPRACGAKVFTFNRSPKQAWFAYKCKNPRHSSGGICSCGRGDSNSHASYGATTSK